jgi:hypothetical protein
MEPPAAVPDSSGKGELAMSDDKTKTHPQDAARINVGEDYEVRYWTEALGISEAALREAVQQVGPGAEKVRQYLSRDR